MVGYSRSGNWIWKVAWLGWLQRIDGQVAMSSQSAKLFRSNWKVWVWSILVEAEQNNLWVDAWKASPLKAKSLDIEGSAGACGQTRPCCGCGTIAGYGGLWKNENLDWRIFTRLEPGREILFYVSLRMHFWSLDMCVYWIMYIHVLCIYMYKDFSRFLTQVVMLLYTISKMSSLLIVDCWEVFYHLSVIYLFSICKLVCVCMWMTMCLFVCVFVYVCLYVSLSIYIYE